MGIFDNQADSIDYNNTDSGLTGSTVQEAIDELVASGGSKPFATGLTDPALNSITQTMIDDNGGVLITLTAAGNSQTLPDPTDVSAYTKFIIINNDTSTDDIDIVGSSTVTLQPGKKLEWIWDGTEWAVSSADGLWVDNGTQLAPMLSRGVLLPTGLANGLYFGDGDSAIYEVSDDTLRFYLGGSDKWYIGPTSFGANITDGATINNNGQSATIPGFATLGDTNTGMGHASADNLSLITGGVEAIRIDASQNVGIGTDSPNTTLDVQGGQTVKVTTVNAATYDLLISDYTIEHRHSTTASSTITIPTVQCVKGRIFVVADVAGNAGTNNVVVNTQGSETINGQPTATIGSDYDTLTLQCMSSTEWQIV